MIEEREAQLHRTASISSCGTEVGKKKLERHNHGGNYDDDYLNIKGHHHRSKTINFFGINEGAAAAEAINNCETESSVNLPLPEEQPPPTNQWEKITAKGEVFIGTHPPKAIPQSQQAVCITRFHPESQLTSLQHPPTHSRSIPIPTPHKLLSPGRTDKKASPQAVAKAKRRQSK